MEITNEQRLNSKLDEIALIYANYNKNAKPVEQIENYTKCGILITEAKRLIEELKIEIINMEKISKKASVEEMKQARNLIELCQLPGLNFSQLKQIIESLRELHNGIPTTAIINEGVEEEIIYDEVDVDIDDITEIDDDVKEIQNAA